MSFAGYPGRASPERSAMQDGQGQLVVELTMEMITLNDWRTTNSQSWLDKTNRSATRKWLVQARRIVFVLAPGKSTCVPIQFGNH